MCVCMCVRACVCACVACACVGSQVKYSWNEGLNWTEFQFWEHHIEVKIMITTSCPSLHSAATYLYCDVLSSRVLH